MPAKPVVLLVLASVLAAVGAPATWALSLTDYRFPESTSQQAYVIGSFSSTDNSDSTTQIGYNLGGRATYDLFHRSLPFSYQINAVSSLSLERGSAADSTTGEFPDGTKAYSLELKSRANKYFSRDSNVFGYGSTRLAYHKLATAESADDPYLDVTVGAGLGRTIDATVLKQAVRMNEDFRKYGIISRDLPDETLLELASIIDREDEFRSRYGSVEYRKYWYEEMEEAVRKSGALREEGLGAMGIIRIQEVLDEPTGRRFHGWEARAGVGVLVSDFTGESGDPVLEAAFDWTRPIGMSLQLTNYALLNTVFQDDRVYNLSDRFQVYYEISNRIDWDNRVTLNYTIPTADGAENVVALNFSSAYLFYLENRLYFTPSFVANWMDDGVGDAEWDWNLSGGITYRLR